MLESERDKADMYKHAVNSAAYETWADARRSVDERERIDGEKYEREVKHQHDVYVASGAKRMTDKRIADEKMLDAYVRGMVTGTHKLGGALVKHDRAISGGLGRWAIPQTGVPSRVVSMASPAEKERLLRDSRKRYMAYLERANEIITKGEAAMMTEEERIEKARRTEAYPVQPPSDRRTETGELVDEDSSDADSDARSDATPRSDDYDEFGFDAEAPVYPHEARSLPPMDDDASLGWYDE